MPCILLVVWCNKSYIISVIIAFSYAGLSYILRINDAFLMVPLGLNFTTFLPVPMIFRWLYQFHSMENAGEIMLDFYQRFSPYFVPTPVVFGVLISEAVICILLLAGKLAAMGLLALILGVYCCAATLIVAILARLPEIRLSLLALSLLQFAGLSLGVYIAVLPLIAFCSRKPGRFMGGSVAAFMAGYCVLFFKSGLLRHAYPFSAALTLIGFDTASYSGTSDRGSIPLAIISMSTMLLISVLLVCTSAPPENPRKEKKSKGRSLGLRPAQQKRQNVYTR